MTAELSSEISNLIVIRNYIDTNINSDTISREEVNQLYIIMKKIDRKIIDLLLSKDLKI